MFDVIFRHKKIMSHEDVVESNPNTAVLYTNIFAVFILISPYPRYYVMFRAVVSDPRPDP